jgi:purine-binding chemotaxis protein CheW
MKFQNRLVDSPAPAEQYLAFRLGGREFGIRARGVREIAAWHETTEPARFPALTERLFALGGKAPPVVDLRPGGGAREAPRGPGACIVLARAPGDTGAALTGIVVDEVSGVLDLAAAEIEAGPGLRDAVAGTYVLGAATVKGKTRLLLDIDKMLASRDLHRLNAILNQ